MVPDSRVLANFDSLPLRLGLNIVRDTVACAMEISLDLGPAFLILTYPCLLSLDEPQGYLGKGW